MRFKGLLVLAVALLVIGTVTYDASAEGRKPASCLLYPYFNTITGNFAVITVTNTCADEVNLRIVFVGLENDCLPKDYWRTLTGYDTFTFVDRALNRKAQIGFCYIYVVENYGSKVEKKADCLIGQEFVFGSFAPLLVAFGVNAVSFAVGDNTVNGDGFLHLTGNEYDQAPSAVMFPRYFGQNIPGFLSFVALMNLTGGKYYEANIGIRTFDDSEHEFSDQIQIYCYAFMPLYILTPDVDELHLLGTSTDLDELFDGTFIFPKKQTGWMELYGINSHYFITQKDNPGIYAVLAEGIGCGWAADLPWEVYDPVHPDTGLWSTSPDGK
jgi:hypothetical protein